MHERNILSAGLLEASCVTIGGFDGVHIGHQLLLRELVQEAHCRNLPSVAITFDPLPFVFFQNNPHGKMILLPEERAERIEKLGVDWLITLPFTSHLAQQTPQHFLQIVHESLGIRSLRIGDDFALGKDKAGGRAILEQLGKQMDFSVHVLSKFQLDGESISSTRIREAIQIGEMRIAARMLGIPYFFSGAIIHGKRLGHKLGFPTINMKIPQGKIIPALGVYAAWLWLDGTRFPAVTSVGVRPTFYQSDEVVVESFLLENPGERYGEVAKVEFVDFLRSEIKFDSASALILQIRTDIANAKKLF